MTQNRYTLSEHFLQMKSEMELKAKAAKTVSRFFLKKISGFCGNTGNFSALIIFFSLDISKVNRFLQDIFSKSFRRPKPEPGS